MANRFTIIKNSYLPVDIKLLEKNAKIPEYSKDGDAGLDLTATRMFSENNLICYGTGIALKIPFGNVGFVYPRSSLSKYDLVLCNHVGVIDSNYTGEIILKFRKTKESPNIFLVGDRIAQLMIMPYPHIKFEEVNSLPETNRGSDGFGSSGA
ncbi:dUTP diphosphatase [bacterium]|nr:dUTP diphosphatase [bacterium]